MESDRGMFAFNSAEKTGLDPGVSKATDFEVKEIAFLAQNKVQTSFVDDLRLFLEANSADILMANANIFLLMIQIFLHHDLLLSFELLVLVFFFLSAFE